MRNMKRGASGNGKEANPFAVSKGSNVADGDLVRFLPDYVRSTACHATAAAPERFLHRIATKFDLYSLVQETRKSENEFTRHLFRAGKSPFSWRHVSLTAVEMIGLLGSTDGRLDPALGAS